MIVSVNEKFMKAALMLAKRGIGSVEPNPAVGAVLVKNDKIIGKGWHKKFGGPHAEINALHDCKMQGGSTQGAVMYVTLEPCCHQGKTAPCTDEIIKAGVAKVVIATIDPSGHANGKGIEQLRNAGIEVRIDICEDQAKLLNAPFIKFAATGKCWTILKWAQSIDGKMAWTDGQKWISNAQSRKDAHKLRRRVQAILVGINTVLTDDSLLTPRPARGKKPARIILDTQLRIPLDCKLLTTAKKMPVMIVTSKQAIETNLEKINKINKKGAELLTVPVIEQGGCDINFLLNELSKRGIAQLLIEGGPTVMTSFLKEKLADEVCVYIAPKILGPKGSADITESMAELTEAVDLHHVSIKRFGDDIRISCLVAREL